MNRTRIITLVVIVLIAACAFLYVNASIYSLSTPLANLTKNVLSKVGIKLASIEPVPNKTASAPRVTTISSQPSAASARTADANRPTRSSRQRNYEQAGISPSAGSSESDTGFSGRSRSGRGRGGFGGESGMDFGRGMPRMTADFNSRNIQAMARGMGFDVNSPEMQAMIKQFADANDTQRMSLMRQFAGGGRGGFEGRARISDTNEPNRPAVSAQTPAAPVDSNMILENLNINQMQMRQIISRLAEWTGKVIIPADESMSQTITIYSPRPVPRKEALKMIYAALKSKGFVIQEIEGVIYIRPITESSTMSLPLIDSNEPAVIALGRLDKSQLAEKIFKLKYYSPTNMSSILLPMIGTYGYINADENANTLLVIETVESLIRFERLIGQFDVPEAGYLETRVFTVRYADPAELVQLLNIMISSTSTAAPTTSGGGRGGRGGAANTGGFGRGGRGGTSSASSVTINAGSLPVTLIPEPTQKWIIAKGSPEVLNQIDGWIKQFDTEERKASGYVTISLKYVGATEVANSINNALQRLPGSIVQGSFTVMALPQAKQLLVVGSPEMRDLIKKLVDEIDIDPAIGMKTKTFKLRNADPDQIKTNIDSIYSGLSSSSSSSLYGSSYSTYGSTTTVGVDRVTVISIPITREVTIIASEQNLEKIGKQIEEWDAPLDPNALKPRIIELKNTDPAQMADLLNKLFSSTSTSGSTLTQYISGSRTTAASQAAQKIVCALYGQLSFEAVPGTKKIIVVSKMPDAYKVVESLIEDLDSEEMAEVPEVVILKYANCEDLSVRLNAMFVENGTQAPLWFEETGLSNYSLTTGQSTTAATSTRSASGDYQVPWSRSARTTSTTTEQVPISNVIGRIRIVPDPHSKSLLVLAPPKYREKIVEMIHVLDLPGKQVMVKAIVLQVDHTTMTTIGVQLANNPGVFGTLHENALTALSQLTFNASRTNPSNAATTSTSTSAITFPSGATVNNNTISVLIDFLVKKFNAKILNQQTLWTKDNEEATFFNGDSIAFISGTTQSTQSTTVSTNFTYQRVGMVLRTRPNITPEKNVDMIVNIMLSQLTNDLINTQPRIADMETTNSIIVKDGDTIMLGGILFQQDSRVNRKIPLLGDIPGIGRLFQHNDVELANSELIVFITPYVVDSDTSPEALKRLEDSNKRLEEIKKEIRDSINDADLKD